jgi:aminoglycoside 3-N-acetyltransferase
MVQSPGRVIRSVIAGGKRSAKDVLRSVCHKPMSRAKLTSGLRVLGVRPGAILLVHSSLSSLGYVPGGAESVISALIDAVGPEGTVVMPTHSWAQMEAGCRSFDVRRTGVCVGAIAESFRSRPGVVRSLHPTHSVAAIGRLANRLTADHELSETPCGPGSPYVEILERDGQILFLGTGLDSNTAYHAVEAVVCVPYLMSQTGDRFTVTAANGTSRELSVHRHQSGIRRRFGELEGWLIQRGVARVGTIGPARCLLLAGWAFQKVLTEALRNDPAFLLACPADLKPS